ASARIMLVVLVASVAFVALSACDGRPLPPKLRDSLTNAPTIEPQQALELNVTGFIGGIADVPLQTTASDRDSQRSAAITPGGELIASANLTNLRDIGWNDLYIDGQSTTLLPATAAKSLAIFATGRAEPLYLVDPIPATGLLDL